MVPTPIRMCVACRTRRPQRDLVRIASSPHGVTVDPGVRLPGRGAYICPDPECVTAAARQGGRAVRRALRGEEDADVQAALEEIAQMLGDNDDTADRSSR